MENIKSEDLVRLDLVGLLRKMVPLAGKFWAVILALIILGGALAGFRAVRTYRPMYRSEAVFSVSVGSTDSHGVLGYSYYYDNAAAQQAAETFPYLLSSDLMRELICQELGSSFINGSISASSVAETNFFVLTVTSPSADDAYQITRAVMNVYPQVSRPVIGETQLVVAREPVRPGAPYNTLSWKHSALKGAACGLLIAMVMLCIMAAMRRTVTNSDDVKKMLNLSCLARIPFVKNKQRSNGKNSGTLVTHQPSESAFCESFRLLRLKLLRQMKDKEENVILFTSSVPSEGKTSLAVNTALTLAKDGKTVLLIDADLRSPSVKPFLGMDKPSVGLGECLAKGLEEVLFLRYQDTSLYVFAGDDAIDNPTPLFRKENLQKMIRSVRSKFDYIVIDTPPCVTTADAAALCVYADKVVYVIREDYAMRSQIFDGVQSLSDNGAHIGGFVLNCCTGSVQGSRYGYGYGKYGYGYGKYGYGYGKYGYGYGKKKDPS